LRLLRPAFAIFSLLSLVLIFQNCGLGFKVNEYDDSASNNLGGSDTEKLEELLIPSLTLFNFGSITSRIPTPTRELDNSFPPSSPSTNFLEGQVYLPPAPPQQSLRDLHNINPNTEVDFTRPTLPPMRSTIDGRVGVNLRAKGHPDSIVLTFNLFKPEALEEPLYKASKEIHKSLYDSATIHEISEHSDGAPSLFSYSEMFAHSGFHGGRPHYAICDAKDKATTNPYRCGDSNDCYRFHLVTFQSSSTSNQVAAFSREVEIEISNPKTSLAAIDRITPLGNQLNGTIWGDPNCDQDCSSETMLEPMFTSDGRLLVFRTDKTNFDPQDSKYAFISTDSEACDITQFSERRTISHAPYDSDINSRYGFAKKPFKDPQGKVIPDNVIMEGTYPWVDREGKNLFMFVNNRTNTRVQGDLEKTIYETKHSIEMMGITDEEYWCRDAMDKSFSPGSPKNVRATESFAGLRFLTLAGEWTNGKMVSVDSLLNPFDFGHFYGNKCSQFLRLYSSGQEWIRLSGSRFVGYTNLPEGRKYIGITGNSHFIDSPENLFHRYKNLKPYSNKDMVWTMQTGRVTQDLAFDEYVSPYVFIYSDMSGSLSFGSDGLFKYQDGYQKETQSIDENQRRLQNSSTSEIMDIPSYGSIKGPGRIEPVALGGIVGKGFYLSENSELTYPVEQTTKNQNQFSNRPLHASLFVAPSNIEDTPLPLITFPNDSVLQISRHKVVLIDNTGEILLTAVLPKDLSFENGNFSHITLINETPKRLIKILINGNPIFVAENFDVPLMSEGAEIKLGSQSRDSLAGWIDEFKVIFENPNYESICNHAFGTMVHVTNEASQSIKNRTQFFLESEKQILIQQLTHGQADLRPLCLTDYNDPKGIVYFDLPENVISLRDSILSPEGHAVFNENLPSFTRNSFCLNCHTASSTGKLALDALNEGQVPSEFDVRRRPSAPPQYTSGFIPKWINEESSPSHTVGSQQMFFTDYLKATSDSP